MKIKRLLLVSITLAAALAGCGGASSSKEAAAADFYAEEPAMYDTYEDYAYEEEMVTEDASGASSGIDDVNVDESEVKDGANQNSSRMLIKNVYMSVETEDADALTHNIESRVNSLGGYIESLNVDTTKYSDYSRKTANIIARVPADKMDSFVNEVEGKTNVLSKESNAEDVTLKYVDMKSKMDSLQTEYDKISELLDKADDLDSIIALQSRLTEIRYQLESYGSQLKVMQNQVSYSTINLNITQVTKFTPVVEEEPSRLEKMVDGFIDNCVGVWNGILDFLVGFVIALPVLLLWGVIIAVIVLIIRAIAKASDKKKLNKENNADVSTKKRVFGRKNAADTSSLAPESTATEQSNEGSEVKND